MRNIAHGENRELTEFSDYGSQPTLFRRTDEDDPAFRRILRTFDTPRDQATAINRAAFDSRVKSLAERIASQDTDRENIVGSGVRPGYECSEFIQERGLHLEIGWRLLRVGDGSEKR